MVFKENNEMNQKKNIYIITSLFPTEKMPEFGSFVYSQAKVLTDRFNVSVLVEKKNAINKFKILSHIRLNKTLFSYRYTENTNSPFHIANFEYDLYSFLPKRLQYWQLCRIVQKYIRRDKRILPLVDIIHAHYTYNAGIIGQIISQIQEIPIVISEHNPNISFDNIWGKIFIKRFSLKMKYAVVSLYEYQNIKHKLPETISLSVLHNVVEENFFPIKKLDIQVRSKFSVLFVGYPHPIKGMPLLFDVINRFREESCCIHFLIVANDERSLEFPLGINEYINENNLNELCTLLPRVKHTQMVDLYHRADVLLSTSYNETFGMSMLEALLCGTPVVATNSGGPTEFLNNRNSILCDCGDVEGLYEGIRKIKTKQVVYNPIDIRNSVLGKYGINNFFNEIESIY